MADSFFVPADPTARGARYLATEATIGPWDARLQHGGPPSALLVQTAERFGLDQSGRADLDAMRVAIEFAGPVPVGEVEVSVRMVRAARSALLVEAALHAAGRTCLTARVWLLARAETNAAEPAAEPPGESATEPAGEAGGWGEAGFPYADHIDWRQVSGSMLAPGPAAVWARQRIPLLPDEVPSGLQRSVLVADSASGLSRVLDWADWSFMNIDLDVHLARPFRGEWVLLDASTRLGDGSTGLASSTLSDRNGVVGAGLQTLVVRRRIG